MGKTDIGVSTGENPSGTDIINGTASHRDDGSRESKNVFERYINFPAIANFGFTLQAGWECVGLTLQYSFFNGGPVSLVYGAILAGIGSTAIAASLGEMASMDPAVGAQYRWSARFAKRSPRFWGLLQGWITVFAWIVNIGGSLQILSNMVQGLIIFNNDTFEPKRWHATFYMWAFILVGGGCNLFLRRVLNPLETVGGICHLVFYIVTMAILIGMSETRNSTEFVFTTLTRDISGWSNPGIAFSLGLMTTVFPITSFDGVLHMIDETKEPRKRVPKSMVFAVVSNAIMQFGYIIAVLFCMGDYDTVAASALPVVEIYYRATKSKAAATAMVVVFHGGIMTVSLLNIVASVSRLIWAFARDKGLPFHGVFTSVHPKLQIPIPALTLISVLCGLLACVNIGSTVAFTALVSLPTVALYISYFIPIFLLVRRKLEGNHPHYGPFKLGRWGVPINGFSMIYIVFILVWTPFPPSRPVTAQTMNYAGPITIGAILIALLDWFTTGKRRFSAPTGELLSDDEEDVQREKDGRGFPST